MPNRILIVDDSREDRLTFRRHLEAGNEGPYLVSEAGSGSEGLARCRSESPDCVLLDYNLPDLNGLEFLEQLQQEFGKQAPAVVMLTGQGNETLAVKALKQGAQDYLVKGLSNPGVRHAIQTAIANVMLRRTVAEQQLRVERLSAERANLLEELQQRAASLTEADRRKDEFLATLAHELRNPLAAISSAVQVLETAGVDPGTSRYLLDVLHRQVHHMVRLVDDLMEVSRITRGSVDLRVAKVDLAHVLYSALETAKPVLDAAGHRLEVSIPKAAMVLDGDPVRLAQIFSNLLNNAAKYTEKGGSIWLSAAPAGDEAVISVRDNGSGIPSDMLPKVFDLFTQVDRTLGRAQGGLGIGLTLAKKLSELHGGRIEVRSDGVNKGSEFIVRLPLHHEPAPLPQPDTLASADRPARTRVLLVDDNVDAAETLAELLRALGADVQVAYDGPSGLTACHAYRPEAMIVDIGMPGMNGYQFAAQIRQQACFDTVLLIALTGWGQPQDRSHSQEAGFNHHLVKPADPAVLHGLLGLPKALAPS